MRKNKEKLSEIDAEVVKVNVEASFLFLGMIEESDNSWTFNTDSGVTIESSSVTDIESGTSIYVHVAITEQ